MLYNILDKRYRIFFSSLFLLCYRKLYKCSFLVLTYIFLHAQEVRKIILTYISFHTSLENVSLIDNLFAKKCKLQEIMIVEEFLCIPFFHQVISD